MSTISPLPSVYVLMYRPGHAPMWNLFDKRKRIPIGWACLNDDETELEMLHVLLGSNETKRIFLTLLLEKRPGLRIRTRVANRYLYPNWELDFKLTTLQVEYVWKVEPPALV